MKKSAMWVMALLAGALLSLTAGCGGGADEFESNTEEAIRLMDEGKNEEAFAILDKMCGSDVTLAVGSEEYGECRFLLGDAMAGVAGLNWLDFIAELPEEEEELATGTILIDVIGKMVDADDNGYLDAAKLAEREAAIIAAINIHSENGTISQYSLDNDQMAQLALESMLYMLFDIARALTIEGDAPLSTEALYAAYTADSSLLNNINFGDVATPDLDLNTANQYIQWGALAIASQTGDDNTAAQELNEFFNQITDLTGTVTAPSVAEYINYINSL